MKIFVTGATSGIGLSVAKHFLKKKQQVYCLGRNFKELDLFVKNNKLNKFFYKIQFDLKKNFNINILNKIEELDKIIICSGFVKNNLVKFFDEALFDDLIKVNLISPIKIVSSLYSLNKIRHDAQIVFVASILGSFKFMPGTSGYSIAKAGIVAATKSLALELAEKNISVNAVLPGMVDTKLIKNSLEISKAQLDLDRKRYLLQKKYLSINEVKSQILYLLSRSAKRITGQTIVIDAGFLLK